MIKTRLRSTTGEDKLESLMLLSCEKYIVIDFETAIDNRLII